MIRIHEAPNSDTRFRSTSAAQVGGDDVGQRAEQASSTGGMVTESGIRSLFSTSGEAALSSRTAMPIPEVARFWMLARLGKSH